MRNFVQRGDTVTLTAPTGGLASGDGAIVGALFGVAAADAAAGGDVELVTRGVFDLPKAADAAIPAATARVRLNGVTV